MLEFTSPEVLESMQFLILSTTETIVHACAAFKTQNMSGGNFPHGFATCKESTVLPLGCITITKKVTQA